MNISKLLSDKRVFWGILVFFVLESVWIALSGRYPMAFDEDFHFGIIKLYAHHVLPFWTEHAPNSAAYGAVSRDPSYLYQWLMGFPYNVVALFTKNLTIQVLSLRFLNIGIFAVALGLYHRLIRKTGASIGLCNVVMALFVLVPVVPLLAAQINYDSLFLLLTAASLLQTLRVNDELRRFHRLSIRSAMLLLLVCLVNSLVKYAFIPIFIAIIAFVAVQVWRTYHTPRKLLRDLGFGFLLIPRWSRWVLAIVLLLTLGLFAERYFVNLAHYHNPVPSCDQVKTVDECLSYGPWARDYHLSTAKDPHASTNPITYMHLWLYGMWLRMMFAVDGPGTQFQTRVPLLLPGMALIVAVIATLVVLAVAGGAVWRRYDRQVLALFLWSAAIYVAVLWLTEYQAYTKTGQPVAINGRYLFPVLPQLMIIGAMAWNELLGRYRSAKIALAAVAVVAMLWGGGVLTYILRSNDAWYWPGSNPMRTLNHTVKDAAGPITPGYNHPTRFLSNY